MSGVLLGYEDVKLKKSTGALYTDQPHIHVDIQVKKYLLLLSYNSIFRRYFLCSVLLLGLTYWELSIRKVLDMWGY